MKFIALGGILAAALAALTLALWPASEADQARDDGEQVGTAVAHVYEADTSAEVDAAVAELDAAVADTRAHAGDALADQVDAQREAWSLGVSLDYLLDQAADFRADGPEVHQAFWEGFESGVNS